MSSLKSFTRFRRIIKTPLVALQRSSTRTISNRRSFSSISLIKRQTNLFRNNYNRNLIKQNVRCVSDYRTTIPASKPDDLTFTFTEDQFRTHRCDTPELETKSNKEEIMAYFEQMAYIRRMELICDQYYKAKQIWGFCHLYDGQEAVCVGIEAALKPGDHIITAYREHGWQYTRGDTIRRIFAEMFGKSTGCARGKGGSMHLYFSENNFYGGNGIVGAQIPVGTGVALAAKQKGDGTCVIAAMGDGAANQGQVYESYNMAKLWNLPIIYLVENNRYGMGTSAERAAAVSTFYTRGDYIPGIQVDGMDVLAVREATRYATNYVREEGPMIMEVMTYRYHGHSMSDPGISYRSQDEVAEIRNQFDPLRKVRTWILDNNWMSEDELKAMEKTIRKSVEKDAKDALNDVYLTSEELVLDIFSTGPPPFVRYSEYGDSVINGKTIVSEMQPEYKSNVKVPVN